MRVYVRDIYLHGLSHAILNLLPREMKAKDKRKTKRYLIRKHKGKCAYCGNSANTIDHVRSKAYGGGNKRTNLVLCCQKCNDEKGTMSAKAFKAKKEAEVMARYGLPPRRLYGR